MTNAEKIRAMSDEDLAILFAKVGADLHRLDRPVQSYRGYDANKNYDWLIQMPRGESDYV